MPTNRRKMLATITILLSILVYNTSQSAAELSQPIFVASNEVHSVDYPDCFCDYEPSCDSCRDYSVSISCKGCDGTYFKDNPVHRKVELDGGWSPEGSEFEIELKILAKEDPQPRKVTVIRVPSDCKFSAFI